jgi:oxygen-independent coproporphyrinogen-3 oxidase
MKNNEGMGIYIHIPFCICKCVYCDFLSAPADDKTKEEYTAALRREIEQTAKKLKNKYTVDTIFFGGGTPTCIKAENITDILSDIYRVFHVAENAEITIECNPGMLDGRKALKYRQAGINRISFGLQSVHDHELKMLGRIHNMNQFTESLNTARNAGFDNINIDIMSALPGQTFKDFKETVDTVIALKPEHISAYSLIVEAGTKLCENLDTYPALPDEDTERAMYDYARNTLENAGYIQYEISNFARKGRECRHNLAYWERKNYLGFGTGAASLFENKRYTNISDLKTYIGLLSASNVVSGFDLKSLRAENTVLTTAEQMEEFMFLGLRKTKGIKMSEFYKTFHTDIENVYAEVIEKNVRYGLLVKEGDSLYLTPRGREVSNVIMSDFIF